MGFRRYVAPTAREALERIRKELGVDAVILSNRRAGPKLVEIIAAASGQMRALVEDLEITDPAPVAQPPAARKAPAPVVPLGAKRAPPESFQEFIRRQTGPADVRRDAMAMYEDMAADPDAAPSAQFVAPPPAAAPAPAPAAPPVQIAAPAPATVIAAAPALAVPAPVRQRPRHCSRRLTARWACCTEPRQLPRCPIHG